MWIRIRAVIVEDEPLAVQYLAALQDDTRQVEVVGSATESEASRAVVAKPVLNGLHHDYPLAPSST